MFRKLVSEVGVLFHSAATIRFDEKMTEVWKDLREEAKIFVSQAVKLNVIAVESVMNLARKMKKLEVNMLYSESFDYSDLKWFFVVAQSISLPGVGPRLNRLCQHRTQPGVIQKNPGKKQCIFPLEVPEEIQDYGDPRNVMTLTKVGLSSLITPRANSQLILY